MYKNLLVPLDGSLLAESVLPAAVYLAGKLDAAVKLIHIIEEDAPDTVHGQRHLKFPIDAENYLKNMIASHFPSGYKVDFHVHADKVPNVAKSIVEHTGEFQPDLIIMCSHGSGGMRSLIFGSIAQQIISLGATPVLIIHPDDNVTEASFEFRNILIPVDGNPEHETGIYTVEEIAKVCNSQIHLIMAIPVFGNLAGEWTPTSKFLPGTTTRMLEMMADSADEYLNNLKNELNSRNISVSTETNREDPEDAIIEASSRINADLIVLGTHGKSGLDAFWSGSVTAKIIRSTIKPVLLVPIKK